MYSTLISINNKLGFSIKLLQNAITALLMNIKDTKNVKYFQKQFLYVILV